MESFKDVFSGFASDASHATNVSNTSPMKNPTRLDDLIPSNNFDPFLKHELKH